MRYKILTFVFLLWSISLSANNLDSLWVKGNEAYSLGEYTTAKECYSKMLDMGYCSYSLYYNLGNCSFKMGSTGEAILNYEKALKLNPTGKDAIANLELAKSRILDKIETLPEVVLITWIKDVRNSLSSNSWAYWALGLFALTALFLFGYRYASLSGRKKLYFVVACIMLLGSLISFSFSLSLARVAIGENYAIVLNPVANVKSAPNSNGNNIFILHEGTKVEILESVEGWSKIALSDGREGWVMSNLVEII